MTQADLTRPCPLCGSPVVTVRLATGESVVCCDNPQCPWTLNEDEQPSKEAGQ